MNFEVLANLANSNLLGLVGAITGVIGAITGVISLFVSLLNSKYNTPRIEIDKKYLIVPDEIIKMWKNKTTEELNNSFLDYELEIVVRNKRGGSGSIDKPNLILETPYNFFTKKFFMEISPITEHQESKKDKDYTGGGELWNTWTVRHGKSFNLSGGEKIDDKLKYQILDSKKVFEIIQNYEKLKYFLKYSDNNGRKFKLKINEIHNESNEDTS